MGRRNKKSGSKTPSPAVSANASPALHPISECVEPPALSIHENEASTTTALTPVVESPRPLPPLPTDLSGSSVEPKVEEPGLVRRILNWIPYFRN
jgi:hypothetical protein